MNKKLTLVAIATSAALFAAGSAQAKTFRLACPSAETSTTCKTASRFAELVGKNAEDLEIQVFPGGQIGSGESAIQQMRAGVIDLVVEDISNYGNFLTDYNVVSWGFTFRDEQHFQDFLVGQRIQIHLEHFIRVVVDLVQQLAQLSDLALLVQHLADTLTQTLGCSTQMGLQYLTHVHP